MIYFVEIRWEIITQGLSKRFRPPATDFVWSVNKGLRRKGRVIMSENDHDQRKNLKRRKKYYRRVSRNPLPVVTMDAMGNWRDTPAASLAELSSFLQVELVFSNSVWIFTL